MNLRRLFIIALTFVFVSLFAVSFKVGANTVETSELITVQGAQIRTTGNAGIRFVANEEYEGTNETAWGIILAFGEAEANEEFVIDGTVNGKAVLKGEVVSTKEGVYTATLYNVPEEAYTQVVTARAYVVDGDKVVYSQNVAVKSLAEVALKAKNDGNDAELVNTVVTAMESYKKYYVDDHGRVYATSAKFESDYQALGKEFLADWNKMFETSLTASSFTGGSSAAFYTSAKSSAQKDWTGSKLVTFYQDATMHAKWSWLLTMINANATNDFAKAQANALKNNVADASNWYYGAHICSDIMSYFTGTVQSSGYGGFRVDQHVDVMAQFADYNNAIYADLAGAELVKVGSEVVLPGVPAVATGYAFDNYDNAGTNYAASSTYTVAAEDVVFAVESHAIEYTIKYYDGAEEITALADTYTVEDEVVLPETFVKEGYIFGGWYDNPECTGNPVILVERGSTGNQVFYASLTEKSASMIDITFQLNGGKFAQDVETTLASEAVATLTISTYSNSGSASGSYVCSTDVLTNNSLRWQYKILLKYDALLDAYEVVCTDAAKQSANNAASAAGVTWTHAIANASNNISTLVSVGQYIVLPSDLASATSTFNAPVYSGADVFQLVKFAYDFEASAPLPAPTKDGYTFAGWYDNAEFTGEAVTSVVTEITLYAKWEAQ